MIEVRAATPADSRTVGGILSRAFAEDPVIRWLLPNGRGMTPMFTVFARHIHAAPGGAEIALEDGRPVGAALWDPPGHALTSRQVLFSRFALVRAMGRRVSRGAHLQELLEGLHPDEPHWYLAQIGALVPGRGIGSALLRSRLRRCDAEGLPAYLESSTEANLPLYEHFGFTVTDEIRLPDGGPVLWPMWRPPANGPAKGR